MTKIWLFPLKNKPRRAEQSAATRNVLRAICDWEKISITAAELTLPGLDLIKFFAANRNLGLSLAHCTDMIAIATSPGRVGVDCETPGRNRNWRGIAEEFYTPGEAKAVVCAEPGGSIESTFLSYWVLKEAYIKAIQGSIFGDLNGLVVTGRGQVKIEGPQSDWDCWSIQLENCPVAVCAAAGAALTVSLVQCAGAESSKYTQRTLPIAIAQKMATIG